MKDSEKIQLLTNALRDASGALENAVNQFDFTALALTKKQTLSVSSLQNCAANARTANAEAETALAMVEDDGAEHLPGQLPEMTPALRMAGAIVAKYKLTEGLSVSQACGRILELGELLEKLSTREASTDAR